MNLLAAAAFIILGCAATSSYALSGYFWHVTDFHMDLNYSASGDANSMCWNTGSDGPQPGGEFGDYRCDSPYRLVKSAVEAMKRLHPDPDFILWTGDDKAHVSDNNFNTDLVFNLIENLTKTITDEFPRVPLVPVLGNHDWFPTHQLPFTEAPLYDRVADLWGNYLGSGNTTFRKGGFYTTVLPNNVRFVGLNTAIYYRKNVLLKNTNIADPGNQWKWFDEVLENAKKINQKVYVSSHVPPGVFERHIQPGGFRWIRGSHNKRFVELVAKHGDTILGQFFAHHHTDSFRVLYDKEGHPISWMLIAPAVTPWNTTLSQVGPNNPSLRKVEYNKENGEITNVIQYYLNLAKANQEQKDNWELEYNFQDAYNMKALTPQALHDLAETFTTPNRTFFDRYYLYNSVSFDPATNCDSVCKHYHYCAITNVDFDDFEACRSCSSRLATRRS